MVFDTNLAIEGLSKTFKNGMIVFTPDDKKKYDAQPLNADELFENSYPTFQLQSKKQPRHTVTMPPIKNEMTIYFHMLDNRKFEVKIDPEFKAFHLQALAAEIAGIDDKSLRLMYRGKYLIGDKKVHECGIMNGVSIIVTTRITGGGCSAFYVDPSLFDPSYDYDFTNIDDSNQAYIRGGRTYTRPIGCKRYAIKVNGKYSDDEWLGCDGSTDEWPVAYHGTEEKNCLDITKMGFDLGKCEKFAYGKGIYCTPDPLTAKEYGREYDYKGKTYVLIFQTRVNPKTMLVVKDAEIGGDGEYWTVPHGGDIRPYGVCIFPKK